MNTNNKNLVGTIAFQPVLTKTCSQDSAIVCDECVEDQIEKAEGLSAGTSAPVIN